MKSKIILVTTLFIAIVMISSCDKRNKTKQITSTDVEIAKDSILFSFSFVGCNIVQYGDWHNDSVTNGTISIMNNGEIQFISRGFDKGDPYYQDVPDNLMKVQDSTILSWSENKNPYLDN